MKRFVKENKGITLIALIITIIVMLILVAVTINVALNGGIFDKAKGASDKTNLAEEEEILQTTALGYLQKNTGYIDLKAFKDAYAGTNLEGYTITYVDDANYATATKGEQTFYITKQGGITNENPNGQKDLDKATLRELVLASMSGDKVNLTALASSATEEGFTVSADNTQYTINGTKFYVGENTGGVDENPWKANGLTTDKVVFDETYAMKSEKIKLHTNSEDTYFIEFIDTKLSYSEALNYINLGYVALGEDYLMVRNTSSITAIQFNDDNTLTLYNVNSNTPFDISSVKAASPSGNGTYAIVSNSN